MMMAPSQWVWLSPFGVDFSEPLLPPEEEAGPVAMAVEVRSAADYSVQKDDTSCLLDPVVPLIHKPLHRSEHPLGRTAIGQHLGHERAALELVPGIERGLDLRPGQDSHPVARLQARRTSRRLDR